MMLVENRRSDRENYDVVDHLNEILKKNDRFVILENVFVNDQHRLHIVVTKEKIFLFDSSLRVCLTSY